MRKLIVAIFFCTVGIFFTSCKKEKELQNTNTPPIARAGADQTITLPNSVIIDGSSSSNANGKIVSYSWTNISWPSSFLNFMPVQRVALPGFF